MQMLLINVCSENEKKQISWIQKKSNYGKQKRISTATASTTTTNKKRNNESTKKTIRNAIKCWRVKIIDHFVKNIFSVSHWLESVIINYLTNLLFYFFLFVYFVFVFFFISLFLRRMRNFVYDAWDDTIQ